MSALQSCQEPEVRLPKAPVSKNGLETVSLCVSPDMALTWRRSANKACLTLSEWIRKKCNGEKISEPVRWRQQK